MNKATTKAKTSISDVAVRDKTGKTWKEWFAILDSAGAKKLDHKGIVALLTEHHGIGSWWRQMITVEYERSRGLREKYQKVGGYSVSRSKTINVAVDQLYQAWSDARRRNRWLPEKGLTVRTATASKSMRLTWSNGKSHVSVYFIPKGERKSQVAVEHERLSDASEVKRMQDYWSGALEKLKQQLEA